MKNKLEKQYKIPVSLCDNEAFLSVPAIFSLFMDMASEHAMYLGIGMDALSEDNLIWVLSKTKVKIHSRPRMLSDITLSTWPEKPGNIRYNRYYTISDANGVIIESKSEWSILDLTTGRPRKSSEVYPPNIEHLTDMVCDEPFNRISMEFLDCDEIAQYTIRSTDIDVSQHMNNVAYIRTIFGCFSCRELEKMNIKEVEIAYRTQCYEGEVLSIRRRDIENSIEIGVVKSDGKTATVLRIVTE